MKIQEIIVFLLPVFICFSSFGQISREDRKAGYKFFQEQEQILSFETFYPPVTVNPNQIQYVRSWFNFDSIAKNFEPFKDVTSGENLSDISFRNLFTSSQVEELNEKLKNLASVELEEEKFPPFIKIRKDASRETSFPVLQRGKDSIYYAFLYEKFSHSGNWGRIYIKQKQNSNWKSFGQVNVPLFNYSKFLEDLKELPEEYQVINTIFAGRNEVLASKTLPAPYFPEGSLEALESFDTWESMQETSFSSHSFNFQKYFSQDDLGDMVTYLRDPPVRKIRKDQLLGELEITSSKKTKKDAYGSYGVTNITFPLIFMSASGEKFSFMYWEMIGGVDNGSGNIVLMQLKNGIWEVVFSGMMWIS